MATGSFRAKLNGVKGVAQGLTSLGMDDTHMRKQGWTPEKSWRFAPNDGSPVVFCSRDELELGGYTWDPE